MQSGVHPDAESLTAFAEQLLPAPQREQILAHMATCSRCREILFLAQKAVFDDQPASTARSAAATTKNRVSGFNRWKWMWIPAAAFAGFVVIAVVVHFRQPAVEPQLAAKLSPADSLSKQQSPNALPVSPAPNARSNDELKQAKKVKPSEERGAALLQNRAQKDTERRLDEKNSPVRKEPQIGASVPPMLIQPDVAGGSIHGTIAARANSSSVGGPIAANQFQQQNLAQQNVAQQNVLQPSQVVASQAVNKPIVAGAAPAMAAETVTVQSDTIQVSAHSAPVPPPQVSSIPLTDQDYEVSSAKIAGLAKTQKAVLPSGHGTLSVASEAARIIALDTAGALFLSEDRGKHWQPIQTQWTGRALLVRTRPVGTQAAALRAPQTMRFELVNDNLQTWISYDGKMWTLEPLPLK
jgi:hypothetical protein